ncbi:MAG: OmpA family protein [Pseudomonadota bacterium]|nr:OmpA family protein [Pseudomonadota bacterium]
MRMPMRMLGTTGRMLLLLPLLAGCASQALLATDFASLQAEIAAAHQTTNCAPKDLAIADANLEFVKIEFEQGDTQRAAEHVRIGREHAKVAAACGAVPPPAPEPVSPEIQADAITTSLEGDSDRDGVLDPDDVCLNDPEDLDGYKDADGCPDMDDDGDGIPDSVDKCPREPEDRDNVDDADGCLDPDNDRDGVPDAQDRCPNEPGEAPTGCASRDRDADGVGDSTDACPELAETVNDYNDADGCPDTKPQRVEVTSDQIVIKQRINFTTGKSSILPDSFAVLDDVAVAMKDYPNIKVEIGGHTDNVGDDTLNQRLSKGRADAVFEYLLAKGVAAQRMITVGYGETRPVDTNMTETGRLNNRRVEFLIQK